MKLHFIMYNDGILEARELGKVYQIISSCKDDQFSAYVFEELICSGNLYECLDACNKYFQEIMGKLS